MSKKTIVKVLPEDINVYSRGYYRYGTIFLYDIQYLDFFFKKSVIKHIVLYIINIPERM